MSGHKAARAGLPPALAVKTLALAALTLALASSCAIMPKPLASDAFSALGSGADAYLALPVAENRSLIEEAAKKFADPKAVSDALDKTTIVYAALFPDSSIRIAALGAYPKSASPLIFQKSKGWVPVKGEGKARWYRSGEMDAAIPASGLLLISVRGGIETLLANGANGSNAANGTDAIATSAAFSRYVNAGAQKGLAFFTSRPGLFIEKLAGEGITLPVLDVTCVLMPLPPAVTQESELWELTLTMRFQDDRSLKMTQTLIRLAMGRQIRSEGLYGYMEGLTFTREQLAAYASFLYF